MLLFIIHNKIIICNLLTGEELKNLKRSVIQDLNIKDDKGYFPRDSMLLNREFLTLDKYHDSSKIDTRKSMSDIVWKQPHFDDVEQMSEEDVKQLVKPGCGQRLAIVGQTQIGKTHLLKQLLKEEEITSSYDYIFYVSLKHYVCTKKTNVLKFLVGLGLPKSWMECTTDEEYLCFKGVVEKIDKAAECKKVCIIFDDFINLDFTVEDYSSPTYLYENNIETGFVLFNLLKKWFKNSQKIFLLHPWQYFRLSKFSFDIQIMVYIVQGINHKSQGELVKNLNAQTKCTKIKCKPSDNCIGFVTKCQNNTCCLCYYCRNSNCHLEIQSLCYVPSNCFQMLQEYKRNGSKQKVTAEVAASVLVHRLEEAFLSDGSKSCCFKHIAKFAWTNYLQKKYFFDQYDITNAKLSCGELFYFFTIRKIGFEYEFCFSHLFLQELLAALWLLSRLNDKFKEEFELHKTFFNDKHFDVIHEFMNVVSSEYRLSKKVARFCKIDCQNLMALEKDLKKNLKILYFLFFVVIFLVLSQLS